MLRTWRFSVRDLLWLTVLAAAFCGWFADSLRMTARIKAVPKEHKNRLNAWIGPLNQKHQKLIDQVEQAAVIERLQLHSIERIEAECEVLEWAIRFLDSNPR